MGFHFTTVSVPSKYLSKVALPTSLTNVGSGMSLAWLRSHARSRNRGTTRNRSNSRLAAQRAHEQFAGAEAYAPRVTYDDSFLVPRDDMSRDATWTSDEQYKRHYTFFGWEIAPIRKDGNCLFRALSDQLYGHERRHLELRRRLIDFIDRERTFFEPFVAGEGVVEYCARLREAGAWGGYPELVAASRLLSVNILVHTGPVKRLRIDTDTPAKKKDGKAKTLNLLLKHDHYTSLRKKQKPLNEQHGCTDVCLCKRIVTPARASFDFGSSQALTSDSGTRSSLGARPTDLRAGACRGSPRENDVYQCKPVPGAVDRTQRTKSTKSRQSSPADEKPTTSAGEAKGVVLFQPESLKPVIKPKAPLVLLFDPAEAPKSNSPSSSKGTVSTATPAKPTSAIVLEVDVEEPEMDPDHYTLAPPRSVHRPRRAIFNGGKRRRSSAAALSLMQEVSTSLHTPSDEIPITKGKPELAVIKPVTIVKPVVTTVKPAVERPIEPAMDDASPNGPARRSVEIKKSSKKVFRQGRPVAAR
ncbi:hypothetical protein PsorP6_014708 [Peronosclerospora sorghi]|uniref:Uncharacterized protein n=1 Tax=Peronosclerospora sorghi TaxID=230839 RepID=A0ACC0VR22_9STRA|nr:hypothetical protein PsorP6_014708 [Peronosclerospora sorghi]